MDMFMDKLAQKLTAQEIIKANTAAETEELNRLRDQINEYDKCLARLKELVDESSEKLQGGAVENSELNLLVEKNMDELNSCLRQNTAQNEHLQQLLSERLEGVDKSLDQRFDEADRKLGERLGSVNRIMGERLESMDKSLEDLDGALDERLDNMDSALAERLAGMNRSLSEKLNQLDGKLGENGDTNLDERLNGHFEAVNECVHRECVKVYRNVQAVVVEESGKQTEALTGAVNGVQNVKKKLGTVLGFSVAAFLLSLAGVVIQVLNMLGITLF